MIFLHSANIRITEEFMENLSSLWIDIKYINLSIIHFGCYTLHNVFTLYKFYINYKKKIFVIYIILLLI